MHVEPHMCCAPLCFGMLAASRIHRSASFFRHFEVLHSSLRSAHPSLLSKEEQERSQPLKNKQKALIPPLRETARTEIDPKSGKEKTKTVYIYPVVIPKSAFLVDVDP